LGSVTNENEKHGEIQEKMLLYMCVCVFWPSKNGHMAEKLLEMCTLTHTLVHTHQYTHTHTQKLLEASLFLSHFPLNFTMLLILIRDAPQKLPQFCWYKLIERRHSFSLKDHQSQHVHLQDFEKHPGQRP
jgi:hypothetical protein